MTERQILLGLLALFTVDGGGNLQYNNLGSVQAQNAQLGAEALRYGYDHAIFSDTPGLQD